MSSRILDIGFAHSIIFNYIYIGLIFYGTISPLRGVRGQMGESRIRTHAYRDKTSPEKLVGESEI